jgi:hypothetical protein
MLTEELHENSTPQPFFRAKLDRLMDGDTLVAALDTWFGTRMLKTLRLSGVNAPETVGLEKPYGLRALKFTHDWLEEARALSNDDWPLSVQTLSVDPTENRGDAVHGRWAAVVWRKDGHSLNSDLRDFSETLRNEYGKPFRYDTKEKVVTGDGPLEDLAGRMVKRLLRDAVQLAHKAGYRVVLKSGEITIALDDPEKIELEPMA